LDPQSWIWIKIDKGLGGCQGPSYSLVNVVLAFSL
jgi:hypothetical protein